MVRVPALGDGEQGLFVGGEAADRAGTARVCPGVLGDGRLDHRGKLVQPRFGLGRVGSRPGQVAHVVDLDQQAVAFRFRRQQPEHAVAAPST